jgi:hypothetical protein
MTNEIYVFKNIEELEQVTGKLEPNAEPLMYKGNIIGFRDNQKYSEQPPARLLSMTLNLCYFLGFLDTSGDHEMHKEALGARERIIQAYDKGKAAHPKSKSGLSK